MLSEEELICVYRESIGGLYEYVSRRCGGDRALSEDVVQECFLRATSNWRRKGLPNCPLAWLKTVARNLLASHFRRVQPSPLDNAAQEPRSDYLRPDTPSKAALIHWGLNRLKRDQVRLLEAFHFDGKKVTEIASELGLSERAVEGRLRRARLALREELRPFAPT